MKWSLLLMIFLSVYARAQQAVERTFGGEKFERALFINHTRDGGYVVCGYSNSYSSSHDIYILKLDHQRNLQWQKTFGGNRTDVGWAAVELKEGGYLLMGGIGIDSTNDDIYLARLDAEGNKLWEKTYGNHLYERATQLLPTADGHYVLIGQRNIAPGNIDSYILKIDANGRIIWENTYGSPLIDRTFYAVETPAGDLLVSGLYQIHPQGKADIYILKLNKDGRRLGSISYGEENRHDIVHSFCMNNDKKTYTLTGYTESSKEGFHDALFMQIDENGKLLTNERHSTGEDIRLMHAEPLNDGGFVVTGYTRKDITKNICDAVLLKYDKNGKVVWFRTFGTPEKDDQGYWIVTNKDGTCTLVGYTHSLGANGDLWMISIAIPAS